MNELKHSTCNPSH